VSSTALLIVAGLVLAAALGALAAGLVALARARRRAQPPPTRTPADPFRAADADQDALRGDPRILAPGDLVEVRGQTYTVRGSLTLTEGGWSWSEHLLDDAGGDKIWMSVEEDPDLEVVLWREVRAVTVKPGAKTVDLDGRRYVSDESGRATFAGVGTTGLAATGTMRYHDYEAADGTLLSFERFGDDSSWEVGRGERVRRHDLRIYPQSRDV
jgi:hypothetical protein